MDRRHRLVARFLPLFFATLASGGCVEEARYDVRLSPASALEGAGGVDIVLLRVACQNVIDAGGISEGWWVVARSQWRGGQPPVDIGEVRPGRYALVAVVRGADCAVSWAQCVDDVELERGGSGTIDVTLQQIPGRGCLPGEVCDGQGLCVQPPPCDNVTVACDADQDGSPFCLGGQAPPACDCADDNPHVHPGAEELCDEVDNDCDLEIDPPACTACADRCPALAACERATCPDGPEGDCVVAPRADGYVCDAGEGLVCCDGECTGVCVPEAVGTQDCGNCGTQERTCNAECQWGAWGTCDEGGVSECDPGQTRVDQPCGNCGTVDETCSEACAWEPDGACTGQGVCAAGTDAAPVACGTCGQRIDTCLDDCTWQTGACEPDPDLLDNCVDPAICCPNGSCGEDGLECCGTDTSTCGAEALCTNWSCVAGVCTEVDETAGDDPEDECAGADCCDGSGACTSAGCA